MNKKFFEMIVYLITSARDCMDEPKIYGSLRLLDSTSMLYELMDKEDIDTGKLYKIIDKINENKHICMTDQKAFKELLDKLIEEFVELTHEI